MRKESDIRKSRPVSVYIGPDNNTFGKSAVGGSAVGDVKNIFVFFAPKQNFSHFFVVCQDYWLWCFQCCCTKCGIHSRLPIVPRFAKQQQFLRWCGICRRRGAVWIHQPTTGAISPVVRAIWLVNKRRIFF